MGNTNMYIAGLALSTIGNIASKEIARDLIGEVEALIGSSNSFIRKKACLTALRLIRKVPDLAENFLEKAESLIHERNHGVLLAGITLLEEMCSNENTDIVDSIRTVFFFNKSMSHSYAVI
jgi:AP-1 complex subunit gamma-1